MRDISDQIRSRSPIFPKEWPETFTFAEDAVSVDPIFTPTRNIDDAVAEIRENYANLPLEFWPIDVTLHTEACDKLRAAGKSNCDSTCRNLWVTPDEYYEDLEQPSDPPRSPRRVRQS